MCVFLCTVLPIIFCGSLISTLTAAVSSQPMALSGRWRLRMYFGAISRAMLIASSEILTESVFSRRVATDDGQVAASQRGLEHVGGIRRGSQCGTRADDCMSFIDEQDQVIAF